MISHDSRIFNIANPDNLSSLEKEAEKYGYPGQVQRIHPNETALAIVRLFLEKLETLTADERKEILAVIRYLNNPMIIAKPESLTLDTHNPLDT